MSVASEEADLIARKKDAADELYVYLDALWNAAANGELPRDEDIIAAEALLERIEGRE